MLLFAAPGAACKNPSHRRPHGWSPLWTIFEPATARIKQWGRTHQQIYKIGRGGVSVPTASKNSPLYSEYALKQAAKEAAEHVLEAFEIKIRDEQ